MKSLRTPIVINIDKKYMRLLAARRAQSKKRVSLSKINDLQVQLAKEIDPRTKGTSPFKHFVAKEKAISKSNG